MKNVIQIVNPFLASVTYLCKEAQKERLDKVESILSVAQHQIVDHLIDLVATGQRSKISAKEYEGIRDFLICLSTVSPKSLAEFSHLIGEEAPHAQPTPTPKILAQAG